jgi:hypothetical protein
MGRRVLLVVLPAVTFAVLAFAPTPAQALPNFTAPAQIGTGGAPSTVTDANGHTLVAYGAVGIHLLVQRNGTWTDRSVTTSTSKHTDAAPSLAVDAAGHRYIAFSRFDLTAKPARSIGIWLATDRSGSWRTSRLTTGTDYAPSVAVDGAGNVHLAYERVRSSGSTIHYGTNKSGSWVDTTLAKSGAPLSPAIALVGGSPNVAYLRTQTAGGADCGVYLWRKSSGSEWISGRWLNDHYYNEFTDCWGFYGRPAIGAAKDGVNVLFLYSGTYPAPAAYHASQTSGIWSSDQLYLFNSPSAVPSVYIDAAFTSTRIDVVTTQFNDCRAAPNCGNGLYFGRFSYKQPGDFWSGHLERLTSRSDDCNQRGSSGTGPYTCDDQPTVALAGSRDEVVFVRAGGKIEYMHT